MTKLDEKLIVKPTPLKGFAKKNVVYVPFDSPSRILQRAIKKSSLKEKDICFGYLYLLREKTIIYHALGAPLAVIALECLIASGAKEILVLGFCGSLNPRYRMMDVVSVSKALSEEGTSRHYFSRNRIFRPSALLKNRIENFLRQQTLPFRSGTCVSTDAFYRETESWLEQKQRKKIDLVDMETSAVFALAKFHRIQAAALMIVSDELWSKAWKKEFRSPELDEKIKRYFLPFIERAWAEKI